MTDELGAAKVLQAAQGLDIPVFVIGQAEGCIPIAQLLNSEQQGFKFKDNFVTSPKLIRSKF